MFYADNYCKCIEEYEPEHTYTFVGSWRDGKRGSNPHEVTVKAPDLFKYSQGALIQVAFPYLSAKDREFLISGMWLELEEEEE